MKWFVWMIGFQYLLAKGTNSLPTRMNGTETIQGNNPTTGSLELPAALDLAAYWHLINICTILALETVPHHFGYAVRIESLDPSHVLFSMTKCSRITTSPCRLQAPRIRFCCISSGACSTHSLNVDSHYFSEHHLQIIVTTTKWVSCLILRHSSYTQTMDHYWFE